MKMGGKNLDCARFERIALEVQKDWCMGGIAGTMYEDYAKEILQRYLDETRTGRDSTTTTKHTTA